MPHADLILIKGNIITMYSEQPKARAVAIRNGRIIAVGSNKQVLAYAGKKTKRIDLEGRTLLPGFIDSHVHGVAFGRGLSQINLRHVRSIGEIQEKVKEWKNRAREGEWIVGHGWDQDRLARGLYPTRWDLDEAAPNHPVFLIRVCGHLAVVNSKALELARITKHTEFSERGCIDKDPETGEPNGILWENALDLILRILPKPDEKALADVCLSACHKMTEEGITTVHWMTSSETEMRILQKLNERNVLPLRIYMMMPIELLDVLIQKSLRTGIGDSKVRVGSIKILTDGSLGARTAALKKPYNDAPLVKGMLLYSKEELAEFLKKAHEAGFQLAIHAIGDAAIEIVLNILEKTLGKKLEACRHRLEHVSVLNPKLIEKMKRAGVIASVQPHFIISDFWIENRLGKARVRWTYPLKSLLKEGIMTIGGSDAPIEPISPILGIYAAVTRKTMLQERLTVDEALRLYNINAAYGSYEEETKGTIEVSKLADMVVLSKDPYETSPEQIRNIIVEMTIVDGEIVYKRK